MKNCFRAFTKESLEKINLRTANLIRDYGYLPKVIFWLFVKIDLILGLFFLYRNPVTRYMSELLDCLDWFDGANCQRAAHLEDGAELPMKFEPFPPHLLGKPVEEIDQFVYEKVGIIIIGILSNFNSEKPQKWGDLVDRPTQLICISDIYKSTYKYKRHSMAIC